MLSLRNSDNTLKTLCLLRQDRIVQSGKGIRVNVTVKPIVPTKTSCFKIEKLMCLLSKNIHKEFPKLGKYDYKYQNSHW